MQIRHVQIENFRGIKNLDWHVPTGFVCLIGSGDSCKSTFLEAIGFALSPMGNVSFDDSDFYNFDVTTPISIQVTVGGIEEVPDVANILLSESNYGLYARGYKAGAIHDEPEEGSEKILTVELLVDSDLEPTWQIIAPGRHEPKPVKKTHLESFGAIKLGSYSDNHFTWSKNSLISRLLDNRVVGLNGSLAGIGRKIRNEPLSLTEFETQATQLEDVVKSFGVKVGKYAPKLDVQALTIRSGGLSLHDHNVPIKRYGTGTKRLIALALQQQLYNGKSIRLIDEIEHGLEPYRITQLIKKIHIEGGQTLATTHSPVVIREAEADNLTVFHEKEGHIDAVPLTSGLNEGEIDALQASLRKSAESFLARKIIVCEGSTEFGLIRSLDEHRQQSGKSAFSGLGVAPIDAGGSSNCVSLAERLKLAGYDVAIFCDSDVSLAKNDAELLQENIKVYKWTGRRCTEQSIFDELSDGVIEKAISVACNYIDKSAIKSQLMAGGVSDPGNDTAAWPWSSSDFRTKLGDVSKTNEWFKRIGRAEELGNAIFNSLSEQDKQSGFIKLLESVGEWCES